MKQIISLLGIITLLLTCNRVKTQKEEVISGANVSYQTEYGKIFTKIYGIPVDSNKPLEDAVKKRYSYSIYDMIDDEGELIWKYSEDDPFVTGHLECKGIMLTDTMMYRLVNDMVRLRNHYTGDMNAVYDWLWHEEMMKEIDTYLNTTYPKKKNFNIEDYVQVINAMVNYVSPLLDGNDNMMGKYAEVSYDAKCLLLIEEYKETVSHCTNSPKLVKAYMDDYRLWMQVIEELIGLYYPEGHASAWDMVSYDSMEKMIDFRLEFLRSENLNLWSDTASDEDEKIVVHFKFDNEHSALSKWYDMRNAVEEMNNSLWFMNTTNKIVREYFRKERSFKPLL